MDKKTEQSSRRYESDIERIVQIKMDRSQKDDRKNETNGATEAQFVLPGFVTIEMVNRLIDRIKRV